ncbi:MAG: hypothetical protein ACLSH0_10060 [Mediterraneibacter faecis]
MKELKFYNKDRDGNTKVCGSMTIKNQTDSAADLFFIRISIRDTL